MLLPYFAWLAVFTVIWYCSRFTLLLHSSLVVVDGLSVVVANFKIVSSIIRQFVSVAQGLWDVIFKIYMRFFKKKEKKQ